LRMLLARLALEAGRAVSVDSHVDGLWGAEPPSEVAGALQALVSRLCKALIAPVCDPPVDSAGVIRRGAVRRWADDRPVTVRL
jgi:hypothetical protein